jgi:hypothetical protein
MGRNLSMELAGGLGDLSLQHQLKIQLQNNHYPPVPTSMVFPCIEAITAVNEGDPGKLIELPEGVLWRNLPTAPASAIVEAHHLDAWIDGDDYE